MTDPIVHLSRTKPSVETRIHLYAHAGGRCEFDNCNRYLLEHHVTRTQGNYGQMGHIVAYSERGPRAERDFSTEEKNDLSNLMLLCTACHKEIDDDPSRYTVPVLKQFKRAHEARVFLLTDTRPDRHTVTLVMKGTIGTSPVEIPTAHMQEAVAPFYLDPRETFTIDLTGGEEYGNPSYWENAAQTVRDRARTFLECAFDSGPLRHVSVFALAPIPLLVLLGSCLSNKIPTTLYQRHRDTEDWAWKALDREVSEYCLEQVADQTPGNAVGLVLSLSGKIPKIDWESKLPRPMPVYETTVADRQPTPRFLNAEEELRAFRDHYLDSIRRIVAENPGLEEIHIFPAVPAPVAVAIGLDRMPKRDPKLVIYDYRSDLAGFSRTLEIT